MTGTSLGDENYKLQKQKLGIGMVVKSTLDPADPDFETPVRQSLSIKNVMKTIEAKIISSLKPKCSLIKNYE
jgi:hypothetical protein